MIHLVGAFDVARSRKPLRRPVCVPLVSAASLSETPKAFRADTDALQRKRDGFAAFQKNRYQLFPKISFSSICS